MDKTNSKIPKRKRITGIFIILTIFFPAPCFTQNIVQYFEMLLNSNQDVWSQAEADTFLMDSISSVNEEKEGLNYLLKYKYSYNIETRNRVADLLKQITKYCKDVEVRQDALFHYVDMHFIVNVSTNFFPKELVVEKTIKRIAEIIEYGIKEEEKSFLSDSHFNFLLDSKMGKREIERIQKEKNCSKDDAIKIMKKHSYNNFSFSNQIGKTSDFIKSLGILKRHEYIPMLEKMLKQKRFSNYKKSIMLSLACLDTKRYGKEYVDKYLANENDYESGSKNDLKLIGSQELCWYYIEANNSLDIIEIKTYDDEVFYTTPLTISIVKLERIFHNNESLNN